MTPPAGKIEVVPTGGALGAELRGVDLSQPLSEAAFRTIEEAWFEHLVLLFRDQHLDDRDIIAFAKRFGELHSASGREYGGKPSELAEAVELISNIVRDGRPIGALGADEATWHTDMSMYEIPASATLLYADEIPPSGGNTRFANLRRAYETLPDELEKVVRGRKSIHDAAYLASGGVRPGFEAPADKSQGPGARHPIVRTHPHSGRKALYLGRMGNGYILGLPEAESDRLLDELWAHMTRPAFVWEHVWRVGDLVVWDNRCVAHARGAFDPQARRLLRRVTVKSEVPV
jgi:taurine dioxygenase